ncbi:MAG TPA: hypothetical protein VFQ54_01270, partial [Thermomicrobiales bacterium]|nr:hypothetical protein [Thermomicrobiales bacterium]
PLATSFASPETTLAAAAASSSCKGIATWYPKVDGLAAGIMKDEASNTATSDKYRTLVSELKDANVSAAKDASTSLEEGYTELASYLEDSSTLGQLGAGFSDYATAIENLSDARHKILSGYLDWSKLGVDCGLVTKFQVKDRKGCGGTTDFLTRAAADYTSWWQFWTVATSQVQRDAEQPTPNSSAGEAMSTPESLSALAYEAALDLAVAPASKYVLDLQKEIVQNFLDLSDLYAIEMISLWGGLLGVDAATQNQITQQFSDQSNLTIKEHTDIDTAWSKRAKSCGVDVAFPALP